MAAITTAKGLAQPKPNIRSKAHRRRKPVRKRASFFSLFLFTIFFIAILATINVTLQALIAQNAVCLANLEKVFQSEKEESERLRVEILKLESPQAIEEIARAKLNMIEPEKVHYIVLPTNLEDKGVEYACELSKSDKSTSSGFFGRIFSGIVSEVKALSRVETDNYPSSN